MTNEEPCKSVWNKFCDSVNSGVFWTSTEFKSACPPKKKKKKPDEELSKGVKLSDEDTKDGVDPSSSKKLPYQRPSDICPDVKSSCYIKMQDPCRPCCCDDKPKPPPCPPNSRPQQSREPICGCELCQKNPNHEKCCDKNRAFRGIDINREYFEKA
ncbi:uncharacterized protein LOC100649305 isoform X1 [Bombus terrestris]|uniref:Uncharacterized protein LOC100649305 isoform X1 n=1 Tax=Bombus terrestris TaxID=30195 RepID=A0A9B2JS23_BOMTE|nr:uncharacterized protein LOC100649305 isoform X1 [Bombus terrestris]